MGLTNSTQKKKKHTINLLALTLVAVIAVASANELISKKEANLMLDVPETRRQRRAPPDFSEKTLKRFRRNGKTFASSTLSRNGVSLRTNLRRLICLRKRLMRWNLVLSNATGRTKHLIL